MEVHPPDIQKVKHIQAMKTPGLVDLNPIVVAAVSLPVIALQQAELRKKVHLEIKVRKQVVIWEKSIKVFQ